MKAPAAAMTAPVLAQVNLLPQEIVQARSLGVVKRWMFASVGVTAVAVGTVAGVAQMQTHSAEAQLTQADAETAQLLAQHGPYQEVTTIRADLDTVRTARAYALADEILWSDYLGALVAVTPDGVGISSVDFLGATPLSAVQTSTDPLIAPGVGTLTFTAVARDVPDTAAWADALDAVAGFGDTRIDSVMLSPTTSGGVLPYEVSGTIQVDAAAYSHRFDTQPEGDS